MEAFKKEFSSMDYKNATYFSDRRIQSIFKLAQQLKDDPDKEIRLSKNLCKPCYYETYLAGQAFTSRKCSICDKSIISSNTRVNYFCDECAKKHNLCAKCGSDISSDIKRKKYPNSGGCYE